MDFAKYRRLFPVTKDWNYLATGASAPLSKPVSAECTRYIKEVTNEGFNYYRKVADFQLSGKRLFAKLVNCRPDEVAIVPSSTFGSNIVALMVDPKKGDNIVTSDLEYRGSAYPWLRCVKNGAEIRVAKSENGRISVDQIEKLVDDKTKVVTTAHVFQSGFRQDLKSISRMAHDHGAYVTVDAASSCGVVDADVRDSGVDFLSTSSYKWLLGLQGSGFLFVRKELLSSFDPPLPGSLSAPEMDVTRYMQTPNWQSIPFPNSGVRFETGMPSIISIISVVEGLKLLLKIGIQNVESRVSNLTQLVIEKLDDVGFSVVTPVERKSRGGHVIISMNEKLSAKDACLKLFKKKIHVDWYSPPYASKNGALFAAPAFFNTEQEIDVLAKSLKRIS